MYISKGLIAIAVLTASLASGCATKSIAIAGIEPDDASRVLSPGDEVHVRGRGYSYLPLVVEEVTDEEIVGEDASIPLDEIETINVMQTTRSMQGFWEGLEAATYLLILWPFFVL